MAFGRRSSRGKEKERERQALPRHQRPHRFHLYFLLKLHLLYHAQDRSLHRVSIPHRSLERRRLGPSLPLSPSLACFPPPSPECIVPYERAPDLSLCPASDRERALWSPGSRPISGRPTSGPGPPCSRLNRPSHHHSSSGSSPSNDEYEADCLAPLLPPAAQLVDARPQVGLGRSPCPGQPRVSSQHLLDRQPLLRYGRCRRDPGRRLGLLPSLGLARGDREP